DKAAPPTQGAKRSILLCAKAYCGARASVTAATPSLHARSPKGALTVFDHVLALRRLPGIALKLHHRIGEDRSLLGANGHAAAERRESERRDGERHHARTSFHFRPPVFDNRRLWLQGSEVN